MGQALDDLEAAIRNADLVLALAVVAKLRELHAEHADAEQSAPGLRLVP